MKVLSLVLDYMHRVALVVGLYKSQDEKSLKVVRELYEIFKNPCVDTVKEFSSGDLLSYIAENVDDPRRLMILSLSIQTLVYSANPAMQSILDLAKKEKRPLDVVDLEALKKEAARIQASDMSDVEKEQLLQSVASKSREAMAVKIHSDATSLPKGLNIIRVDPEATKYGSN